MNRTGTGFSPRIVDSLVDSLLLVADDGRIVYANPALGRLLGRPVEELANVPVTTLLPERARAALAAEFRTWMASDPPLPSPGPRRIEVLAADGTEVPVDVATFLVAPPDGQRLLVVAIWDTELRVDVERFRLVADDLMRFLAGASGSPEAVISDLLGTIATRLGFEFATAWRWDDIRDVVVCEYAWCRDEHDVAALRSASLGMTVRPREGLAGLVADTDAPQWFGDLTQAPHLKRHDAIVEVGMQSAFIFPIRTKDRLAGVIELFSRTKGRPDQALFDAIAAIGSRLGEFLDRLEWEALRNDLMGRLEAAHARQAFLLESSVAIAEAGNFEEAILRLGEVAVPVLGEVCLIDVVTDQGTLARLAARHADPYRQGVTDRLLDHPPSMSGNHPAALAVRTGEPQWSTTMDEEFMAATTEDDEHLRITQELGFRSYVSVPLVADHDTIGALTVVATAEDRTFGGGELGLAQDLARQVATVVDRARTLDEQSTIARRLQESLLPDRHVTVDGLDVALRYEASGRGAQVGGDFYDVVPLGGARLALVMGDVEGHDVTAATVMGQLGAPSAPTSCSRRIRARSSDWWTASWPGRRPTGSPRWPCSSWIRTAARLALASAGHPSPVIRAGGGPTAPADVRAGPPVGVGDGIHPTSRTTLAPSDVIVLYTDGLLDVGLPDHDLRMEQLVEVVEEGVGTTSREIADRLMGLTVDRHGRSDDAALLVATRTG